MNPIHSYGMAGWSPPHAEDMLEMLLSAAVARDRMLADPARRQQLQRRPHRPQTLHHTQLLRYLCTQLQAVPVLMLTPGQLDAAAHLRAALHLLNRAFSFAPLPQNIVKLETWCVGVVMTLREAMVAVHSEGTIVTLHEAESRRYSAARAHYMVALRYLRIDHAEVTHFLAGADRLRHPAVVRYLPAPPLPPLREMMHHDIQIVGSTMQGQCARAMDFFPKGTLVLVEKPFASVLLPWLYHDHCYHCLERMFQRTACARCGAVQFCSEGCRVAAADYHRVECPVMSELAQLQVPLSAHNANQARAQAQLAWRMVTQLSLSENLSLYCHGVECGAEDLVSRARLVHAVIPLGSPHYMRFLPLAEALKDLLMRTDFFYSSDSVDRDELIILDLLMRSLMQVSNNHHYVTQSNSFHRTHVAMAIYATGPLFNRDSTHNLTRDFAGTSLLYRTTAAVRPGQVLADNIIGFELQFSAGAVRAGGGGARRQYPVRDEDAGALLALEPASPEQP